MATEKISLLQLTDKDRSEIEGMVVTEYALSIFLNGKELVTLLCSPIKLKYLALGFLGSEGFIKKREDIESIVVEEQRGTAKVKTKEKACIAEEPVSRQFITSSKGITFHSAKDVGQTRVESKTEVAAENIFALMQEFQGSSSIYHQTGGVHSAALSDGARLVLFSEDIGRHNAIDKIFGETLWENIPVADKMIISSGRISSEILLKVARRNVPILVSKAAPTDLAIRTATALGITLIGLVKGKQMNVYANGWRVIS